MIVKLLSSTLLLISLAFQAASADEKAIKKTLAKVMKGAELATIKSSPLLGMSEVSVGAKVFYMSDDGRYILQGDFLDMDTQTNLTEESTRKAVKTRLAGIDEDKMIVFKPEKTKHTITVFTDIDCGYCRKMHNEMPTFLENGIQVRYMMYPREGKNSEAYKKAVAVWCSDDRNESLTKAKNNKALEMKTCDNPIDEHMDLAGELGLRGTPLVVLEDGTIQPGYIPAKELAKFYDKLDGAKK